MRAPILTALTAVLTVAALATGSATASAHDGAEETQPVLHGHTAKLDDLRAATASARSGPIAPWSVKVVDLAGISCIEDPHGTGAMGIHYLDPANLFDGKIDRLAPEALIYEPGDGGSLTLIAAEYLVLAQAWDATHAAPPILYGQRFTRVAAGNRYGLPDFYELHVWHQKANPSGIFNDWNPTVSCS
ncbi:hypothetical protein [Pedococcus bigeumensis]|uniref:hypothetical protein n=1 Tax=Pedococcus bigeumensis TaxID=433644 RepID=UPI0031DD1DE7